MKLAYFTNHRNLLKYNNGPYVQLGDTIEHNGKQGKIFSFDWLTVNINYDDGSSETNIPVEHINKTASIVDEIVKNSYWINN